MNTRLKLQIESLAKSTPNVEICGMCVLGLGGLNLIPCTNVSSTPSESFEISHPDYMRVAMMGRILYVYHSHPKTSGFSQDDIDSANESLLGQRLFSVPDGKWHEYTPPGGAGPLEGRMFAWGEQDCHTLLRDYYLRHFGISIGDYDRDETSADLGSVVLANFEKEGFVKSPSKSILYKHSVLVFRTNGSPQHIGIFLGNSKILHHPLNALSRIDQYGPGWQRRLHMIVNHKSVQV